MKNKILLSLIVILAVFTLSACGAKKEIAGIWHLTGFSGGQSLSDYAKSIGLNEILAATTYNINEDGTFTAESGLSLAMGQGQISGTWKYSNGSYVLTMSDGTQYQAELKDGNLNIIAADGTMILEPGAADIDAEEAKRAYAELAQNTAEPGITVPSETESPDSTASPGSIEETQKPEEETQTPAPESINTSDIYDHIIGKIWIDGDGNYYDFYNDNTCYVKYKNGSELTGEYQFIEDGDDIVFDMIINESEQLRTLVSMDETSISFKDDSGSELKLTKTD